MKIAVFHNLPSGGAKRALYGFVKYLTKSGHIVDIFVPSTANESFLPLKEFTNEFNIFPVKKSVIGIIYSVLWYLPPVKVSLADLEKTEKKIANVINKKNYDVVLSEQDQYTMSPFFLKFIKKPTIYYCQQPLRSDEVILQKILQKGHNNYYQLLLRKMWRKCFTHKSIEIDKRNASFAKYILVNSYFSRETILRKYGLNSFVSYLGVDTELFKPLKIAKENLVLSVGSCGPAKGFDFIIRSLARINSKVRPKLIIASNSIDIRWKNYLEQIASETNVKLNIKTLISNDKLVQLYNKAKLILYAPYLEPFGLVPLEAMACATPIVAVKEGGVRETVINNETGLLTERDEEMFAKAISDLLLNNEKRKKMGQKGKETIGSFWTLEHAGKRLLHHLNRAKEVFNSDKLYTVKINNREQ